MDQKTLAGHRNAVPEALVSTQSETTRCGGIHRATNRSWTTPRSPLFSQRAVVRAGPRIRKECNPGIKPRQPSFSPRQAGHPWVTGPRHSPELPDTSVRPAFGPAGANMQHRLSLVGQRDGTTPLRQIAVPPPEAFPAGAGGDWTVVVALRGLRKTHSRSQASVLPCALAYASGASPVDGDRFSMLEELDDDGA